jgi:hypothetical protein
MKSRFFFICSVTILFDLSAPTGASEKTGVVFYASGAVNTINELYGI